MPTVSWRTAPPLPFALLPTCSSLDQYLDLTDGERKRLPLEMNLCSAMSAILSARGENMKRSVFLLVLLIASVREATAAPQAAESAEGEIRSMMAQARQASLEGDSNKIASLMADEYVQTDISGHVQDKSTWLKQYFDPISELIKAGKFRWEVYERKDVQIRVYGDSAVVIGALDAKGSRARWMPQTQTWAADPSATFSGTLRFTHVYIRRNGKWLLVALHNAVPVSTAPTK